MSQSVYEMAEEYSEAAEHLKSAMDAARLRFKKAKAEKNEDECQKLLRLISVYRQEISDMKIISEILKNYDDAGDKERRVAV